LFPDTQIEELLSWAHIQAVAWRAGVSISIPERDFGVDGTFRQLTVLGSRRFPSGQALDFQLKASKQCMLESNDIVYDLEVKTYNDLVVRNASKHAIPCVLLLKVIPIDSGLWIDTSEEGLLIRGGCYWAYLEGKPSTNKNTVRIHIPRTQQFTPACLINLLKNLLQEDSQ